MMERLSDKAIEIINNLHTERLDYTSEYLPLIEAAQKLSAYEDTWLEPEEYKRHADAIKKLDIEHMHNLLQAENDGRLVVMSSNTPLTPEELQNLALKKWVWIDDMDGSKEHGAGSAYYRKSDCYNPEEVFSCGYPGWKIVFEYADYGKTWLAYRQKPKEETHGQNKN